MNNEEIDSNEITIFLDWIDKLRVGLWLMYYTIDKNHQGIIPNFFINQRVSSYDRLLYIVKSKQEVKGITFFGVNNFSFLMQPSVFGFTINNYLFINISSHNLLSRRMGFPYSQSEELTNLEDIGIVFRQYVNEKGKERIMKPLLRKQIPINGTEIYQSILNKDLMHNKTYNNDYLKNNLLNMPYSKIISNLSNYNFICKDSKINIQPNHQYDKHEEILKLGRTIVLDFQLFLDKNFLKNLYFDNTFTKEEEKKIRNQFKTSIKTTITLKNLLSDRSKNK